MAVKKTVAAKPPAGYHAVKVPDPRADPDYMQQHANLTNQQADYTRQQQHGLSQYNTTYNQNLGALGYNPAANHKKGAWDMTNTTPGTYGAANRDVGDDFVSRGMGYSTPYATALQNMKNDYTHRLTGLATGLNQYKQTQADQANTYSHSNQAADRTALRDAIARISSRYGVQGSQVIPGRGNTVNVRNP